MSTFVKKVGNRKYYEINGIRAGGIIPYYIDNNNNVIILINKEFRNKNLIYNIIGGKVEKYDKTIKDTIIREFNEETGFLVNDKIEELKKNIIIDKKNFFFKKAKYLVSLVKIKKNIDWEALPILYQQIFQDIDHFNDRDSEELKWVNLFSFNDNKSYLLTLVFNRLKKSKLFEKYNKNKLLFID